MKISPRVRWRFLRGFTGYLLGAAVSASMAYSSPAKIAFRLDALNSDGLRGADSGLSALHYEYCIPDEPAAVRAVSAIDPTLEMQKGSPGRIGCRDNQILCLGNTHQPRHRHVLAALAALPFVAEIREAFFE